MPPSTAGPGLVEAYRSRPRPGYDEMLSADGAVRPAWQPLSRALDLLGSTGLASSRANASRLLDSDGAVYRTWDTEEPQRWQLDPVPLLLDTAEWAALAPALAQRARLLNALVVDLYGARTSLHSGVLPAEVVLAHPGFLRACDGLSVPGPHQLFTVAADLARDGEGRWVVLHDRTASPSGAGFAMENRRVVSRVLTGAYRDAGIEQLAPFFQAMRRGLQEVAPAAAEAPRVVLLTSGPLSETAYDQAFLSQLLGYPLVAGSDLVVREGKLWLRGLDGSDQVDVVLRRVDSDFCDPLELRAESQLGVPGLLEVSRLGTVSVVNVLGAGVLENPGLLPYLPALCRHLLAEELALPSAATWWCGDPEGLRQVRDRFDQLVLKPISRGASRSSFFLWELSTAERAALLARVEAEPHLWVGQEQVAASTAPTFADAQVAPHSLVLRTFAIAQGGEYHVMPGGLVRVAAQAGSMLVSSQAGAVAKDAWVLSSEQVAPSDPWLLDGTPSEVRHVALSPRMAEDLFWFGRYTERAESTTRLLRAVRDRTRDVAHSGSPVEAASVAALLQVLAQVTGTRWTGDLLPLLVDVRRPGSLAHAVHGLTTTARGVRDQLSADTWLVLASLENGLHDLRAADSSELSDLLIGPTLSRSLSSLLALAGLSAESMVRDLGWQFLEAGRRLERCQQVVALLRAALVDQRAAEVDGLVVESVLVAAESIITFRRRYTPRSEVTTTLELLLVDRGNPRSVSHQLDRLCHNLRNIPDSAALLEEAEALGDDVRASYAAAVAAPVVGGRRAELLDFLLAAGARLRALGDAVERSYFEELLPPVPLSQVLA